MVDDDADILETTVYAMRKRGFDVYGASSGPAAVEICQQHPGEIDALVADLSLPGESTRFAQTIAGSFPNIKIVYATGIPRHIALSTGLVPADAPYLQKPVDADLLANVLRGQVAST
ncbi:CheY-like chemotaxis protein [Actinoplanes tereljensis]|uniref:response regulator n=1 Tax=Paractinoplanes tereljensis TaxID=571912 RepID=UPI0019405C96|nr:response regulator [Actinoplanes tereljensis]